MRPEIDHLIGDYGKAKRVLGWERGRASKR